MCNQVIIPFMLLVEWIVLLYVILSQHPKMIFVLYSCQSFLWWTKCNWHKFTDEFQNGNLKGTAVSTRSPFKSQFSFSIRQWSILPNWLLAPSQPQPQQSCSRWGRTTTGKWQLVMNFYHVLVWVAILLHIKYSRTPNKNMGNLLLQISWTSTWWRMITSSFKMQQIQDTITTRALRD